MAIFSPRFTTTSNPSITVWSPNALATPVHSIASRPDGRFIWNRM